MSERISREARRAQWADRIEQWQESGQSGAAFCRDRELVYSQFIYWRKRFAKEPEDEAAASDGFVAIAFEDEPADSCGVRVRVSPDVELVLEHDFDAGCLVRAVKALQDLAC